METDQKTNRKCRIHVRPTAKQCPKVDKYNTQVFPGPDQDNGESSNLRIHSWN